jgi:cell division protein FtsL
MSSVQKQKVAPFISILIIVSVMVTTVFFKMEAVRQGYELLSLGRQQKITSREKSTLELQYSLLTRPQRLDTIATKFLALSRAQKNQIVVMASVGKIGIHE